MAADGLLVAVCAPLLTKYRDIQPIRFRSARLFLLDATMAFVNVAVMTVLFKKVQSHTHAIHTAPGRLGVVRIGY